MKNKKMIFIVLTILCLIAITIFCIYYYKTSKNGNTIINKSEEKIVEDILNMKNYEAKMNITVETNKNKTQYVVKQKLENNKAIQEVIEPSNIAGVITEYDGNNLIIKNNKLNLETIFQNYQYIVKNRLWLDSFVEEYKSNQNVTSSDSNSSEIILKVQTKEKLYNVYKELYIDKKTGTPAKMIVKDINQKTLVYILYTEIKIS